MIADTPAEEAALLAFHQCLLPETLRNALETPFYRQLWSRFDAAAAGLDQLRELPLVDKVALREAGRSAQNRDGLICNEIFTGGTTGVPSITVRGDREQRYIEQFFRTLIQSDPPRLIHRGFQINNPYHGHDVAIPSPFHFHRIGVYDRGCFDFIRGALAATHQDRGVEDVCSVLVGPERCLRALTHDCLNGGHPEPPNHLQAIVSYAQYMTPAWRARHRAVWKCPVIDRFSLSEAFGGASEDPASGWWHWDPQILPEAIGAESRAPIREGVGLLVITALFPFQEAQPLVRYVTGDLVEVTHQSPRHPGRFAFKPLGRARSGLPLAGTDDWLILPNALFEIIDELDEVARLPRYGDSSAVKDPHAIGHALYSLSSARTRGDRLEITLRIQPRRPLPGPTRARLGGEVADALLARQPLLASLVGQDQVRLKVAFGAIDDPLLIAHAD